MKRRDFVKKIAGAGALIGFPTLIPARALGRDGNVAPSERLTLGSIGLGGMGIGNTHTFVGDKRVQLVALCDVNNSEGKQFYGYGNNETESFKRNSK